MMSAREFDMRWTRAVLRSVSQDDPFIELWVSKGAGQYHPVALSHQEAADVCAMVDQELGAA